MKTVLVFEALKEEDRRALEQEFGGLHFVYGDNPNWPGYLDTASAIVGFLPEEYRFRLKSLPALELVQLPFAGYEGWPERVTCPLANASGSFGLAISEYLISAILFFIAAIRSCSKTGRRRNGTGISARSIPFTARRFSFWAAAIWVRRSPAPSRRWVPIPLTGPQTPNSSGL
nr:hypothetical protein [Allobaculum sp. Allo2]